MTPSQSLPTPTSTMLRIEQLQPRPFNGRRVKYPLWRAECAVYFYANRHNFPGDDSKTCYMLSLMRGGEAIVWMHLFVIACTEDGDLNLPKHEVFLQHLDETFDETFAVRDAVEHDLAPFNPLALAKYEFFTLRQAGEPISSFNRKFKSAADMACIRDEATLIGYYKQAVDLHIRMEMRMRIPQPCKFSDLAAVALQIDHFNADGIIRFASYYWRADQFYDRFGSEQRHPRRGHLDALPPPLPHALPLSHALPLPRLPPPSA